MTRFAIELSDRLLRSGRDLRFVGRRNDELDFQDERAGERLVLTDLELALEVAAGKAVLVKEPAALGVQPQSGGRPATDLSLYSATEREAARRRLAYVLGARVAGLTARVTNAALAASVEGTAAQLGDPEPPHFRSLRRWLRSAGNPCRWAIRHAPTL